MLRSVAEQCQAMDQFRHPLATLCSFHHFASCAQDSYSVSVVYGMQIVSSIRVPLAFRLYPDFSYTGESTRIHVQTRFVLPSHALILTSTEHNKHVSWSLRDLINVYTAKCKTSLSLSLSPSLSFPKAHTRVEINSSTQELLLRLSTSKHYQFLSVWTYIVLEHGLCRTIISSLLEAINSALALELCRPFVPLRRKENGQRETTYARHVKKKKRCLPYTVAIVDSFEDHTHTSTCLHTYM